MGKLLFSYWKRFAAILGRAQTFFLMTVIYFVIVPIFSLVRLRDPLGMKLHESGSYWLEYRRRNLDPETYSHLF
jgi:hypothetical protein